MAAFRPPLRSSRSLAENRLGTISLSLVSHTNAGKTTLARTLLGRDVGEVRDAPHVTEFADAWPMLETAGGERLLLWDTPGFGDSARLVRRLQGSASPLGWFLAQVWDRWRDRPFWSAQQAIRNLRDEADVMLYLVNAAEAPEAAGYVEPEMALLGWIGKPVLVLLNQLGAPRAPAEEAAEVERWRVHLAGHPQVQRVLPLDAFARCWVQEGTLLEAIEAALPDARRAAMGRLRAEWDAARWRTFHASMAVLAGSLARLAGAAETVPDAGPVATRLVRAGGTLGRDMSRRLGAAVAGAMGHSVVKGLGNGLGRAVGGEGERLGRWWRRARDGVGADAAAPPDPRLAPLAESDRAAAPLAVAEAALVERLDREVRSSTAELIALHGLEGRAEGEILARVAANFDARLAIDEGRAALWSGALGGALAGLKADLLSGGLTLGGGLVAGGLLGALGGAGVARGANLARGTDRSSVAWSAAALEQLFEVALLRYLAVAHFGRGRGEWAQGETPPHWRDVVRQALAPHRAALAAVFALREPGSHDALRHALDPLVAQVAADVLRRLYPEAPLLRESAQAGRPAGG